jgi:hypothetical protein
MKCAVEGKSNYWVVTYIVTVRLCKGFLNGFSYHVHLQRLVRLHLHVYFRIICGSYEFQLNNQHFHEKLHLIKNNS